MEWVAATPATPKQVTIRITPKSLVFLTDLLLFGSAVLAKANPREPREIIQK
jgi:hypothetical protein